MTASSVYNPVSVLRTVTAWTGNDNDGDGVSEDVSIAYIGSDPFHRLQDFAASPPTSGDDAAGAGTHGSFDDRRSGAFSPYVDYGYWLTSDNRILTYSRHHTVAEGDDSVNRAFLGVPPGTTIGHSETAGILVSLPSGDPGLATYSGKAAGVSSRRYGGVHYLGTFTADVDLTLSWVGAAAIGGWLTNFVLDDGETAGPINHTWSVQLPPTTFDGGGRTFAMDTGILLVDGSGGQDGSGPFVAHPGGGVSRVGDTTDPISGNPGHGHIVEARRAEWSGTVYGTRDGERPEGVHGGFRLRPESDAVIVGAFAARRN